MELANAARSVSGYLAANNSHDLSDVQVEKLVDELTSVRSDRDAISPQEVAVYVDQLFPELRRLKMQRVVPPITSRAAVKLSGDELNEKIREALQELEDDRDDPDAFAYWAREDSFAHISPISKNTLNCGKTVYFNAEGLRSYINAAKLPLKEAVLSPLVGGWNTSLYRRFTSGDKEVLRTFRRENHPEPTAAAFRGIINILGQQNSWPLNNNGEEARLHKAVAMAKRAILLQGTKTTFPVWEPAHGKVRWHNAAELDRMSVQQLLTTIESVSSLYKQMKGDWFDQRERLADFADAAAGIRRYREGDIDSLSGTVQFKESSPNNAYEFIGKHSQAKPTADPRMDRSAVSTTLPPNVAELFTDKTTGKFYTKTALHKLARTNTNLFRTMMRSGYVDFMNQLLAQPE